MRANVNLAIEEIPVNKNTIETWKKYGFEFLSIFVAVVLAFALDNWNENRKEAYTEKKILAEIANGLEKDLDDLRLNELGHRQGISACIYFRKVLAGQEIKTDSLMPHFFNLTRDFISIQNVAGYETLKSKGLELIENDSLRLQIISLYEYDYNSLRKLEEEYAELQFQESYFKEINQMLAPNFKFDAELKVVGMDLPLKLLDNDKKVFLLYLWKIRQNRLIMLGYYADIEKKVDQLRRAIRRESKRKPKWALGNA